MEYILIAIYSRAALSCSHLIDLLLVQVKDLPRGGGSDLLVDSVARLRAVPTVPSQHKYHLRTKGAGGVKRITNVQCLLSTDSLSVGFKVTLMLIVT